MSNIFCLPSIPEEKKLPFKLCMDDFHIDTNCIKRGKSEIGTRILLKNRHFSASEAKKKLDNQQENFPGRLVKNKAPIHFFNFPGKHCNFCSSKKYSSTQFIPTKQFGKPKISKKFISGIAKILEKTETGPSKFDMCKQALDHIGTKDVALGKLLKIIGTEYENHIQNLTQMLEKTVKMLKQLEIEVKKSECEINKIKTKNSDLIIKLQNIDSKYTILKVKFKEFTEIGLSHTDQSDNNWKKLAIENKAYGQTLELLKKESLYYKEKAVKMMKLLLNLEKKGYPIDYIYNNEVSQKFRHNSEKLSTFEDVSFEAGSKNKFVPLEIFLNADTPFLSQKNSEIFSTQEN